MKSLLKIRRIYVSTHRLRIFLSFFLVPSILFVPLLFGGTFGSKKNDTQDSIQGKILEENITLLDNDNFNVTQFLKTGAIVTENKEDCDIINNIIYKNKSSSLICETKESDIPHNSRNVVKIINDNGKYILELIELIEDFISEDD